MNKLALCILVLAWPSVSISDDVSDSERMLCSLSESLVCLHSADCLAMHPTEVGIPQFVVLDTRKKTVSATKTSVLGGSSDIENLTREGGLVIAQGRAEERAFSFVIDEATGILTASTASDGYTISTFGACTDAKLDT